MPTLTDKQIETVISAWAMAASARFSAGLVERFIKVRRASMVDRLASIIIPKPRIKIAALGLKPLGRSATMIMDLITQHLDDPAAPGRGSHRRIENSEVFSPAVIERIGDDRYSVAHYFEQNGDQIADPDIEFIHEGSEWYPAASTLALRPYRQAILREEGQVRYDRKEYASLRALAEILLKNIKEQQGLETGKNAPPLKEQLLERRAYKRGRDAFALHLRAVPAHDPELTKLIDELGDKTVGKSLPLLRAWSRGWHEANAAAPVPQPDRSTEELIQEELLPRMKEHPAFGVMSGKADRDEARTLFEKILRESLTAIAKENDGFRELRDQYFEDPGYRAALVDKLFAQEYSCPIVLPTKAEVEEKNLREKFRERVIDMIKRQGWAFLENDDDAPSVRNIAEDLQIPRDKMMEWLFKDPYIRFSDRMYGFYLRPPAPGGGPPPDWADYEELWENGEPRKFWRCSSCMASVPGDEDPNTLVHNTFCPHGPVQFPAHKLARVKKLLDDLNRKAKKLGVGGDLTMNVVREFPYKVHVGEHDDPNARYDCTPQTRPSHWPDVPHLEVEFTGSVPKMPGFDVLGVIEHPSEQDRFAGITANIIRELPGRSVPARFRTATNLCEHCKLARNRLETVVLSDEAGRVIQVGRSCLADYVGTDDAEARVRAFLNFQSFWESIRELVDGKGGGDEAWSEMNEGESKPPRVVTLERFLIWVAACVREDKAFVSAKMTGDRYKFTSGECAYDGGMGELDKPAEAKKKLQDEDIEAGEAAALWAKENLRVEDAKSNFDSNLAAIVARGYVKSDTMNMASWIFRKWQDAINPKTPEQGQRKVSDWRPEAIGAVVEMRLTLVRVKRDVGQTYDSDLYVFEDEEGRSIVLFTAAKDGPEIGDVVEIKAEIRSKDTRNNLKQTKVGKKSRGWTYISRVPRASDVPEVPAAEARHFNRDDLIERIVTASRKPVPEIRELSDIRGTDGKWYFPFPSSLPVGVSFTSERSTPYFLYHGNGSYFGTRATTRQELVHRHERAQDAEAADTRDAIQGYSDDLLLQVAKSLNLSDTPSPVAAELPSDDVAPGSLKARLRQFGAKLIADPALRAALQLDNLADARAQLVPAIGRLRDELARKGMGPLSVQAADFLADVESHHERRQQAVTRLKARLNAKPAESMPRGRTYA